MEQGRYIAVRQLSENNYCIEMEEQRQFLQTLLPEIFTHGSEFGRGEYSTVVEMLSVYGIGLRILHSGLTLPLEDMAGK